jgi:hypothetical protein
MTKQKPLIQLDADRLTFVGLLRLIETDAELLARRKRDLMSNLRSFARLLEIDMERSRPASFPSRTSRWLRSRDRRGHSKTLGQHSIRRDGRVRPLRHPPRRATDSE